LNSNGSFSSVPYQTCEYLYGVNASGQIVGDIGGNSGGFVFNPAPGPIPGTGPLSYISLGLLGLGSVGWKRLRQRVDTLAIG
jgi:hypothetical protein